jgi:hypothetical protein
MISEKERLTNLLKQNIITFDEYNILLAALDKKPARVKLIFSFLINPFQKIAGLRALIIGLVVILCMSYLGVIAKVYFPGILDVLNAALVKNPKASPTFFLLIYQNMISWLILSILFIITAKIFQPNKTRIIDFFGTVALSRFPYLFFVLFICIIDSINPNFLQVDASQGYPMHTSSLYALSKLVDGMCVGWQVVTYFSALQESSGLSGKKLWIGFIISMVAGYIISTLLTYFFI